MYPSTPSATFKKLIHSYNAAHEDKLPDIRLHDLRHISATLLISQNVDVKTISTDWPCTDQHHHEYLRSRTQKKGRGSGRSPGESADKTCIMLVRY